MKLFNVRLTKSQFDQLDYLTGIYGSQATAFRTALDLLYTLRRLDERQILDIEQVQRASRRLDDTPTGRAAGSF